MSKQHWVGPLFDMFVRMIAAARYTRASAPLVALMSMVIVGATIQATQFELARDGEGFEQYAMLDALDLRALGLGSVRRVVHPGQAETAPATAPIVVRRVPALDAEQQNVARFIARRYSVAIEQTQHFVEYAYRSAREFKVDPLLILAVISVESSFNPQAQSHQGAQGLMQVLTRVHVEKFAPFGGVAAAFDPLANIKVGVQILREYLTRDGSVEAALKAYVGAALLPHDGGYGAKVLSERERIAAAAQGRPDPDLQAGSQPPQVAARTQSPAAKDRAI